MKVLALVLLLLLAGCSSVPFKETELVPTRKIDAAEVVKGIGGFSRPVILRQSALFELRGMRVPLDGVMKLDPQEGSARLVGMNDMGVKLYDISVDRQGTTANFIIAELARYPHFAEAVGNSVRRIFLAPHPSAQDRLKVTARSYLLTREEGGRTLSFLIGGAQNQLLEKSCEGDGESWRVHYYEYQPKLGFLVPGGIVLDDRTAGYRLTLWLESVETTDE